MPVLANSSSIRRSRSVCPGRRDGQKIQIFVDGKGHVEVFPKTLGHVGNAGTGGRAVAFKPDVAAQALPLSRFGSLARRK
jgi:hypothetical protein